MPGREVAAVRRHGDPVGVSRAAQEWICMGERCGFKRLPGALTPVPAAPRPLGTPTAPAERAYARVWGVNRQTGLVAPVSLRRVSAGKSRFFNGIERALTPVPAAPRPLGTPTAPAERAYARERSLSRQTRLVAPVSLRRVSAGKSRFFNGIERALTPFPAALRPLGTPTAPAERVYARERSLSRQTRLVAPVFLRRVSAEKSRLFSGIDGALTPGPGGGEGA